MRIWTDGAIDLFFNDLNEEAQKQLLEMAKITSPEEANWDSFPIATFYIASVLERTKEGR